MCKIKHNETNGDDVYREGEREEKTEKNWKVSFMLNSTIYFSFFI